MIETELALTYTIDELIMLLQQTLIQARIARQAARFHKEWARWEGIAHSPVHVSRMSFIALSHRMYARELLQEIEMYNGRLYTRDLQVKPLKDHLNGRMFKKWPCYQELYDKSVFAGVDPS